MSKKNGGFYNNPNGCMSLERLVELKKNNEHINYIRKFKLINDPCPPKPLRHLDSIKQCMYCESCYLAAFNEIKELKHSYKVGKEKFDK